MICGRIRVDSLSVTAHKVEANAEDLHLEGALDHIETGMNLELPQLYEQLRLSRRLNHELLRQAHY